MLFSQAELYLTREVNGQPVERSEGEEFTFINDLPELGSIRYCFWKAYSCHNHSIQQLSSFFSSILEEPNNRRNPKRPSDEPGPRTGQYYLDNARWFYHK